jgi:hypothetical protein
VDSDDSVGKINTGVLRVADWLCFRGELSRSNAGRGEMLSFGGGQTVKRISGMGTAVRPRCGADRASGGGGRGDLRKSGRPFPELSGVGTGRREAGAGIRRYQC